MGGLLVVAQTLEGGEIPLHFLSEKPTAAVHSWWMTTAAAAVGITPHWEHASMLEAQARTMGVDLSTWLSHLLQASRAIWPGTDSIEPGREVISVKQRTRARRVRLSAELLARLAGPEWSNRPHAGVLDWIGLTISLAAGGPENVEAVQILSKRGVGAAQVAHALLAMDLDDREELTAGHTAETVTYGRVPLTGRPEVRYAQMERG